MALFFVVERQVGSVASRIQEITVEIGGDTTKLSTALSKVNKEIRDTQGQLKDVNKLLKLNSGNTELMAQKHRLLAQAVGETKEKLAGQQANDALARGEISQSQYDALQREIVETEKALKELEMQAGKSAVAPVLTAISTYLLTMTAPYKYKYEPWTKICSSEDWTISALDFLGGRAGLTGEFKYSTLGIHILTGIIAKVSGMKTVDFANQYLFEPLGMKTHQNYLAETAEEHKAFTLSKAPKGHIWFCDPQGIGTAGYGLCLSAMDAARIGQLCLDKGMCGGKQIVSSKWIEEMTKPRHQCGEEFRNMSYGYFWWVLDRKGNDYSAIGDGGNVIYVSTTHHIVIAVTSYFKPAVFDRVDFIQKYIVPLLVE